MVLLFHGVGRYDYPSPGWPRPQHWPTLFITEGYTGVALFMVLSGFILTYAGLGKRVGYGSFLRNRALRLLPLLMVVFVIAMVFDHVTLTPGTLWLAVAPPKVVPGLSSFIAASWSIVIEVELYLFFPVLLRQLDQHGPRRLLAVVALLAGFRFILLAAGVDQRSVLYWSVVSRADEFILGMVAAWVLRRQGSRLLALAAPAGMALSVLLMVGLSRDRASPPNYSSALGHQLAALSPTAEGLGWACFVIGYVALMRGRSGGAIRTLARVGATSYSIYLLHSIVITTLLNHHVRLYVGRTLFVQSVVTVLVIILPVTLLASRLGYRFIEQPFLRRRVRWAEDKPQVAPLSLQTVPAQAAS
jgi:peptidoglycan/LPS O-acetylase OafA/YrhL